MTLHLPSFAEKVRRCREMFGESIDDVSRATGISTQGLTALEGAGRTPTGDEVLILADHFLCDYRFFVSNEQTTPIERTEKLFRAYSTELSTRDRWAIQEFLFLCENEAYLLHELQHAPAVSYRFAKRDNRDNFYKGHGTRAASELRSALGHKPEEVPEVFFELRRLGMHVFRRRLENVNISGLFINHPSAGACVLVNYNEDIYRQRFTAAHEAAHSIFDAVDEYVVSFGKWAEKDLREVRADAFAGAFLVPTNLVDRLPTVPWTEQRLLEVADRLGVNVKVLLIALEREGRLKKNEARTFEQLRIPRNAKEDPELPDSLSAKGRQRKQTLLERGISSFYAELCFEGVRKAVISAPRAAEMLLVDDGELRELASLFGVGEI
jgi:Zn-dependent peptidase ImmA (M78 family)/transcriptional regulator with XRE-family HTH domain